MLQRFFSLLILVALSLLVFTGAAFSQQNQFKKSDRFSFSNYSDKTLSSQKLNKFLANLSVAIQSENLGLRRSAIYLSGLYSLNEIVPTLVEQLEKEDSPEIKILIALALFRMDDPKGMEAVEKLYIKDDNLRVKRMSKAILDEYRKGFLTVEGY